MKSKAPNARSQPYQNYRDYFKKIENKDPRKGSRELTDLLRILLTGKDKFKEADNIK